MTVGQKIKIKVHRGKYLKGGRAKGKNCIQNEVKCLKITSFWGLPREAHRIYVPWGNIDLKGGGI